MLPYTNAAIVIPRLYVRAFNATSAPHTWGAPSPTALIGFATALQLRNPDPENATIHSAGLVVHSLDPMVNRSYRDWTFNLTRNPVDKSGSTPGIVEEGRANMVCSLVLGLDVADDVYRNNADLAELAQKLVAQVLSMRFSGGSIFSASPTIRRPRPTTPLAIRLATEDDADNDNILEAEKKTLFRLLPGFALVSREDALAAHHARRLEDSSDANLIDSWMDFARLKFVCEANEDGSKKGKVEWKVADRPTSGGWLVPIPTGYMGISEKYDPGVVHASRSDAYPFQFVEPVYSVGEWLGPHRVSSLRSLLWYAHTDEERQLYLCKNDYVQVR